MAIEKSNQDEFTYLDIQAAVGVSKHISIAPQKSSGKGGPNTAPTLAP